jgi:acyl-CoA thioester hydrolase
MKPKSLGLPPYEIRMHVPFHDLDPMQIVWHGNYLKYFDTARQGLFRSLGVDLYAFFEETGYLFPVIRNTVKYIQPLRYHDEFVCTAALVEVSHKLVVDFEIRLVEPRTICTKGRGEQAAVKYPDQELCFEIPETFRERLPL